MNPTVALIAEFDVLAGSEDRVSQLMTALAEQVRAEPGNIAFEPYTRQDDPRHYIVYEIYRDQSAFDAHITADYGLEFNRELAGLVEGDGSVLTWLTRA